MSKVKKFAWMGTIFFLAGVCVSIYLPGQVIDAIEAKYSLSGHDIPLELGLGAPILVFLVGAVLVIVGLVLLVLAFIKRENPAQGSPISHT